MCTLLHDIGESLGPFNHGEVAAAVLGPFVSEANRWTIAHHPVFQLYFYGSHLGLDPNARYDEVSFDPSYRSEPMATLEPMVRRVLQKPWTPPA